MDREDFSSRSASKKRSWVSVTNSVSFGHVLTIIGMMGCTAAAIYEIGAKITHMEEGLLLESRERIAAELLINNRVDASNKQEERDLQNLNDVLKDIRNDYRELLKASQSSPGGRK